MHIGINLAISGIKRQGGGGGGAGAPINTVIPTISGVLVVGETLTAGNGSWSGSPATYSYKWFRGSYEIPSANMQTYVLAIEDSFLPISVQVVASNAYGPSTPATSVATALVAEGETLWSMFDPHDSLTGRTVAAGAPRVTQALGTSPVPVGGAVDYTMNGAPPAAPDILFRLSSFNITTPIQDTDQFVTFYDAGASPMVSGNTGGKMGVAAGVGYAPPAGAGATVNNPGTSLSALAGGLRASSQSAFLMRQSGVRWSQQTFPQTVTLQTTPFGRNQIGTGIVKIGPTLKVTRGRKPCFVFTLDDLNSRQYTELFPLMQARNLVATIYTPFGFFGDANKLTLAQGKELKDAGWAFCMNSGPNDEPINKWPTVADAIANLNSHAADLIASGLSSEDDVKHLCYSYGNTAHSSGVETLTCTSTGSTTLTTTVPSFWTSRVCPGMVVKGTGVSPDPIIVDMINAENAVLDRTIPSGTYPGLRFCGMQQNLVVTCDGSTTITNVNTTGLVVGMQMQGQDVPPAAGVTITAIVVDGNPGVITVSAGVPITCARATFWLASAPWAQGNLIPELIAAGYRSAVGTSAGGGVYTAFGKQSDYGLLSIGRQGFEAISSTQAIAEIQADIYNGKDHITGHHWASSMSASQLIENIATLDWVAARRDAGDFDVVTVPQWYDRITARPAPAIYAARFGTLNTSGSGAFNTALYAGPTPADGTYGQFTVASGVITPNTTPLTAGTYSVGGWPVTVSATEFAVANQAQFNAISAAQNGMRVIIREGALLTIPRSWRQNQNVAGMILEGDCVEAPNRTIQNANLDSRAHIVSAAFGGQDNLTLNRLRVVTGSTIGTWVNGITLQDQPEDMQITNCAIVCSRPDPYGDFSGGNSSFPGAKGIVFATPGVWRCSIRDVAIVGAREFAIEAGAVLDWVEIIGLWADLCYGDGVRVPTSSNIPFLLGGYLYTRPMAIGGVGGDTGDPHADVVQTVGNSYGIVEAVAFTDAGSRGTGAAQGIFLAGGISRDTVRDCLAIDRSLWPFSAYLPENALVERLAWVPPANQTFPVSNPSGGMRFGQTGVTGGTNILRNSSMRGFGAVHVSITQTDNLDTQSYGAAEWTAAFPGWTSLPATEVPTPATLSRLFTTVGRASAFGPARGKAPLVQLGELAPWSSYALPRVAAPVLTGLAITPTVGGGDGTIQTTVPLDPISWAVCPVGTATPTAAAVKRRKVSGALAYGNRRVSRPEVGTSLAFTLSGLASGTPVIVFLAQFNGGSKSTVTSITFTPS